MTERKPQVLLNHYLKKLKLPTIRREYAAVAGSCAKDNCDYVSFLLRLVEREALDREKRLAERRVKNARFPTLKTLDRGVTVLVRQALHFHSALHTSRVSLVSSAW